MAGDNVVQGGERGRDVFPAQGTACTKSQQDRAQGLWQTLQQASMAGEGGLWEAGGWTRPDQEFPGLMIRTSFGRLLWLQSGW